MERNLLQGGKKPITGWKENYDRVERKLYHSGKETSIGTNIWMISFIFGMNSFIIEMISFIYLG